MLGQSVTSETMTSTAPRARRRWLAAAALVAVLIPGCGQESKQNQSQPAASDAPVAGDPGPVHVHGLGINPKDGALFVATHTGLFRAGPDEDTAKRVGDRYQDTMGFTVTGPDTFLGSGHPDGRDGLPPYLGLIESRNAGRDWRPVSLLGKVDFHVLEAAASRVYGFGSDFETREPRFLVSDDRGRSWHRRDPPAPLVALAVDPRDSASVVASDGEALFESRDAGRTWRPTDGPGGLLAWSPAGDLSVVTATGDVHRREGYGEFKSVGEVGGEPAAYDSGSDALLVALHDGTIKQSRDGGRTWRVRSKPAPSAR